MLEPSTKVFLLYLDSSRDKGDLNLLATTIEDYEKFIARKADEDPRKKLLKYLYLLAAAFSRKDSKELLRRRPSIDIEIYLKPRAKAPYKRPYRML